MPNPSVSTRLDRALALGVVVLGGGVMALARWLSPAAAGVGTHQQLGLGACAVLTWTGWPCPVCGMTTTFSLLAHGDLGMALVNQPFGVVLFALTAVAVGLALAELLSGRGQLRRAIWLAGQWERVVAPLLLLGLLGGWLWKALLMKGALL